MINKMPVSNFLLLSRINTPSLLEKSGDLLLTPVRVLFGGKQVLILQIDSMHTADQLDSITSTPWIRTTLKVIAFIMLPLVAVGIIIKLICLKDQNYRTFCAQKIPQNSASYPKLFEMFQHIHSTANFVSESYDSLKFEPLELSECLCKATNTFHRLRSPRRNNLENAIVQRLVDSRPDKNLPVHLLSMGSGGLMADFITLEKLVLAGFTKISIDCVDPKIIDAGRIERIRKFFANCPGISIEISAYKSIDDVPAEKSEYSALLAVDYDDMASGVQKSFICAGDLMKAYRRLTAEGFLGLGYGSSTDFLSGPQMAPVILSSRRSLIHSLANDLGPHLPQTEEITIGLPDLDFAGVVHLFMLSLAFAVEKSVKPYRTISIALTNNDQNSHDPLKKMLKAFFPDYDQNDHAALKTMMKAFFPKTNVEIGMFNEKNKKCDLLITGSVESEFSSKNYLSFLSPQSTTYILYPRGKVTRQNNDREDQRVDIMPSR